MKILLIGSGGREHALAWKLAQSPNTTHLFATPGNPGIAQFATLVDVNTADHSAVVQFCIDESIGLVVIGPEAPLVAGLADDLTSANIPVFGPSKLAAQLEGSKGFVKDLCAANGIPTAGYVRHNNAADATASLDHFGLPVVIKADGLAAGKGVIIAETYEDAKAAIIDMFDGSFGDAGAEVVIEEFMTGEEASLFAITDGNSVVRFGSAQDHKRVGDGDTGPNTGGMGAYSPARVLTSALEDRAMTEIVLPTVRAMQAAGMPYSGVMYAGLMLTQDGPKLVEYNCRFGDPECQVLMTRYQGDLAALMLATAQGRLSEIGEPVFAPAPALTIVMAANGYPGTPEKGGEIHLPETDEGMIFHAGTVQDGDTLRANGGRVLNVTASGHTVAEAQRRAYALVDQIDFPDGFCRRDIGWREVAREAEGR